MQYCGFNILQKYRQLLALANYLASQLYSMPPSVSKVLMTGCGTNWATGQWWEGWHTNQVGGVVGGVGVQIGLPYLKVHRSDSGSSRQIAAAAH